MILARILFTLAALFTLVGCAAPAAPLRPEVAAQVKSGKVAALAYVEDKTIEYNEQVYKVMWNEDHRQGVAFTGLWDIDRDLTEKLARELQGTGLSAVATDKALPEADYKALCDALAAMRARGITRPVEIPPELREKLRRAGIDYVVVLRSTHFLVQTGSFWFNHAAVNLPAILVVYDVKNAREEYRKLFVVGGNLGYEGTVRDIERDGLRLLRNYTHAWLERAVRKGVPEMLSPKE